MPADTQLTLLSERDRVCGGLAVPFGVRALRNGAYFTAASAITLPPFTPVMRTLPQPVELPPVGQLVDAQRTADGVYVRFVLFCHHWPGLLDEIRAGNFRLCVVPRAGRHDWDQWIERYVVARIVVTRHSCFIPQTYPSGLAYLCDALGDDDIPEGLNPVWANLPMERA